MKNKAFQLGIVVQMLLAMGCLAEGMQSDYESGMAALHGTGVPIDQARAFVLLERAAEAGHAAAQGALGAMLATGTGCAKDEARAVEVLGKASEAGVASAMFNLGVMRMKGQGGDPDVRGGLELVTRAAEKGFKPAILRLAEFHYLGTEASIPADPKKALPWVRKAAEAGNPWAQNALGTMLEHGQGTPVDRTAARAWYEKAALRDFHPAQNNLGLWYRSGPVDDQDDAMAYAWFSLGAPHIFASKQQFALLDALLPEETKAVGRQHADKLKQQIASKSESRSGENPNHPTP